MANRVFFASIIAVLLLICAYEAEGWRRRRRRRAPPKDCVLSSWGSWGRCSLQCGLDGRQRRYRRVVTPAQNGGKCDKPLSEARSCIPSGCQNGGTPWHGATCLCKRGWTGPCCHIRDSVDGNWSQWGSWSPCTRTCGAGRHTRQRKCDNPAPSNGGAPCPGPDREANTCIIRECLRAAKAGKSANSTLGKPLDKQ